MIEAFVRAAIETTSDEAAKPRLRRCVPPLLVAVKNWAGSPAGEVVMAAATPKAAFMFVADDWPDIDEGEFQTHEVARALVGAIESSAPNKSDVILGATAALLGEAGLDAQREEQERIADTGAVPLVVTLVEHDGRTVAVMVTVIPMPAATLTLKKNPRRQRGLEGCAFEVSPLRGAIPRATPRSRPHAQAHR